MKDVDKELLSRILDEDLSEFETQRILKEMRSDDELGLTLQRYDVIGHALRKELPKQFDQKFVRTIHAQLENEEMDSLVVESQDTGFKNTSDIENVNKEQEQSGKFKAVVGLAIAASVAVFSFLAFQNIFQPELDTQPEAIVAEQQTIEPSDIQRVSSEDLQNFITHPEAAASFNSYIMNHAEYASPRVSVPHVRIVGYGKEGSDK